MADSLAEAGDMTAAAVGGSAVAVEPLDGAALHGTKGPAGAVAEAVQVAVAAGEGTVRSEEHTSELQSH